MFPAPTIGDQDNAGGTIIDGASTVFVNGKPVALLGSTLEGPEGMYNITTASSSVFAEGRPRAIVGSVTSIDSQIVTGSPNVFVGI